eukprot:COSAG02_NODE_2212_length_9491_cov_210.102215_2_plen_58_part_00
MYYTLNSEYSNRFWITNTLNSELQIPFRTGTRGTEVRPPACVAMRAASRDAPGRRET